MVTVYFGTVEEKEQLYSIIQLNRSYLTMNSLILLHFVEPEESDQGSISESDEESRSESSDEESDDEKPKRVSQSQQRRMFDSDSGSDSEVGAKV